mmetsp:Transcript_86985/g.120685  ORF Transcript_86985/g.120685 Transcript_86985/m.120685 type:complete len:267 (+) Transcript_86985:102-902(+)
MDSTLRGQELLLQAFQVLCGHCFGRQRGQGFASITDLLGQAVQDDILSVELRLASPQSRLQGADRRADAGLVPLKLPELWHNLLHARSCSFARRLQRLHRWSPCQVCDVCRQLRLHSILHLLPPSAKFTSKIIHCLVLHLHCLLHVGLASVRNLAQAPDLPCISLSLLRQCFLKFSSEIRHDRACRLGQAVRSLCQSSLLGNQPGSKSVQKVGSSSCKLSDSFSMEYSILLIPNSLAGTPSSCAAEAWYLLPLHHGVRGGEDRDRR